MGWSTRTLKKRALECLNQKFAQAYIVVLVINLITDIPALCYRLGVATMDMEIGKSIGLLSIFLIGLMLIVVPLTIGRAAFYIALSEEKAKLSMLWSCFAKGVSRYVQVTKNMSICYLSILAGALMLIIPGVLQYYRMFFVPWILAEHPEMHISEVMKKSVEMTKGEKLNIWIMQMSFIGWIVLGYLVAQRLNIFIPTILQGTLTIAIFALPYAYYHATVAELYKKQR